MVKKWSVVIVEDELGARLNLKNLLLTRYNDIQVVGEAENTHQALALFNSMQKIDGIFMDIALETDSQQAGLDLAFNLIQCDNPPWLVFTTAYSEYAMRALNYIHPVGYLLKPLDTHRLDATLDYVRNRYGKNPVVSAYIDDNSRIKICHRITNKYGDKDRRTDFIKPSDIVYVRKNQNSNSIYIKLLNGDKLDGISGTLEQWQKKMNQSYFFKIYRSYFINLRQAQSIYPHSFQKETYQLSFKCCAESLTIGGVFYNELVEKLKNCDW